MSFVIDGNEKTSRSPINETKSLASQTDSWSVHNWQVSLDILREKSEE
jgi:hypothetical protein